MTEQIQTKIQRDILQNSENKQSDMSEIKQSDISGNKQSDISENKQSNISENNLQTDQLEFKKAISDQDIKILSKLANVIWREHYCSILDEKQIDYMLTNFQSESAIIEQLKDGYEYYFLVVNNRTVGYSAIKLQDYDLFISKLYIKKEERRKGYGSEAFSIIENIAKEYKKSSLWLTVNRFNEASIQAYKKNGFQVVRSQVTDIKGGYVMDDFVMEKQMEYF